MTRTRVVVNADDFGVSRGATLGIAEAHHHGVVTSASFAVTTKEFEHTLDPACECPELSIGPHFTHT